jgi:RHS repeat-associated protein
MPSFCTSDHLAAAQQFGRFLKEADIEPSLPSMRIRDDRRRRSSKPLLKSMQVLSMRCSTARYYTPTQGQFISQDPVFWEIGLSQDGKNALSNPQALNSYGYASDNPITNRDPQGRNPLLIPAGVAVVARSVAVVAMDYPILSYNYQHGYPLTYGLPSWREQAAVGVTAGAGAGLTTLSLMLGQPELAVGIGGASAGFASAVTDKAAGRPVNSNA